MESGHSMNKTKYFTQPSESKHNKKEAFTQPSESKHNKKEAFQSKLQNCKQTSVQDIEAD